jgi:hypothetical protein
MKLISAVLLVFFHVTVFAQANPDSSVFNNSFVFNNGIYTSLEELKENAPRFLNCELDLDKKNEKIYTEDLHYINSRKTRLKYEAPLYAVVADGRLSIFYKTKLNTIFLKGALSTFILEEVVTTTQYPQNNAGGYGYPGYGYPGYGMGPSMPITTSHVETNIYFLDYETGIIEKVSRENLEPFIYRDAVLYESFKKIKGDSNHRKSYPFISQYNTRNPVYIAILPEENTDND